MVGSLYSPLAGTNSTLVATFLSPSLVYCTTADEPKADIGHFRGMRRLLDRLKLRIEIEGYELAFLRDQNHVIFFRVREPNIAGELGRLGFLGGLFCRRFGFRFRGWRWRRRSAGLGAGFGAISSCVEHAETISIREMAATPVTEIRLFIFFSSKIRLKSKKSKPRVVYCTQSWLVKQ